MSPPQPRPATGRLPMILWAVSCVLVLGAIIGGLGVTGGPLVQREHRFDELRVQRLNHLLGEIQQYTEQHGRLPNPEQLRALAPRTTLDPATNKPLGYTVGGAQSFSLCATFTRAYPANDHPGQTRNATSELMIERPATAGPHCFRFEYESRPSDVSHELFQFRRVSGEPPQPSPRTHSRS